jgi:serine/threonine protein kinase/tetratricopeptide (TPR) repeat protein
VTAISTRPPSAASPEPDRLLAGRYSLGEPLGEGGMGTVYRAEQLHPVRRPVAVKLIKAGMDTARVVARFEVERQALALMDHPNIARVLDAGATDQGRPFFVMELVSGAPLTAWCDARRLTIRERLELFLAVCGAVRHAHQKGVIHRDLKPANILVAEVDGQPVPKVIDFGLAKALEAGALPNVSTDTGYGTVLGTPLYMAPEQADPGAGDVDTRADIYALGVVLYELLVGSPPLARDARERPSFAEMLRRVREVETPPLTAWLRTAADLPAIAAARNTDPARLPKEIRGELEWIVLKCLEKDRTRRYETANGLAADVQRYLANEPVAAGPASRWYKARKFVRRHRGAVLAASLVLLALIGGVVGTTWALVRAVGAERLASQRLTESETARARAEAAEKQATAVADYLVDAFRKPDPFTDGRELKVVDLLDKAVTRLDGDRDMDPLARARLQDALAQTYFGLGLPARAVPLLEQAKSAYEARYGIDHAETLAVMHRLMYTYGHAGRNDEAIRLGELVLERRKALLGPDHKDTLLTMGQLGGRYWAANRLHDAIPLAEKALEGQRKVLGPDHADLPNSISNLAILYRAAGRTAAAVRLHEEAVALRKKHKGLDHPDTLLAVNFLGQAYRDAGRTEEAIALQQDTVEQMERKLGGTHPRTLLAMSYLASTYRSCGKREEALSVSKKALDLARKAPQPDPETVLRAMDDLALAYSELRRSAESLSMLREIVATATRHFGPQHPRTTRYLHNLGVTLRQAGQLNEAVTVLEQALAGKNATSGEMDPGRQTTTTQLASAYVEVGRTAEAIALLERLLGVQKKVLDPDHRDLLVTMANLALAYESAGRTADAVRYHEQVVAAFRKKFGPTHPDTQTVTRYLGTAYRKDKRLAEAERTYRDLEKLQRQSSSADPMSLGNTLVGLGEVLLAARQFEKAEAALREGLGIYEKARPDVWTTFDTRSLLGAALLGQKKYTEAEPLLVSGYEGMKAREAKISPRSRSRLTEALERLIELYEATGRKDEAAKWRKKG